MNTGLEAYSTDVTPKKIMVRLTHVFSYLFLALVVSLFWVKWAHEDNKLKDAEKAAVESGGGSVESDDEVESIGGGGSGGTDDKSVTG